ncbi:unnamed protein product, partial [Effrenium voratum]
VNWHDCLDFARLLQKALPSCVEAIQLNQADVLYATPGWWELQASIAQARPVDRWLCWLGCPSGGFGGHAGSARNLGGFECFFFARHRETHGACYDVGSSRWSTVTRI